ncbi:MAG: GntR family transcriptional regulator [Chloroflexi bacterium]|nr:GntR family transcriptional regulator [Chloroflexota bacterium]
MKADVIAAMPVYLQLELILTERIRSGELKMGSKLPSESELAAEFGVSRSTVRKVLDRLAADGLIVKWPGKGSYVSAERLKMTPTSLSFSQQMIAAGHSVSTKVLLRKVIPAPEHIAQALGLPTTGRVVYFRRLRILDGEPVAIHTTFLPYPQYEQVTIEKLERTQSLSQVMEEVAGVRVVSSHDVLSVIQVDPADAALLNIPPNSPVVLVRGVGYTLAGTPARCTEAIYRSDRFEFTIYNSVLADVFTPASPRNAGLGTYLMPTMIRCIPKEISQEGKD